MTANGLIGRTSAILTLALLIGMQMAIGTSDANAATISEEQRCLALSLYWEARGEGRHGMLAVGWTVLNRVYSNEFPNTPCKVIYQGGEQPPCQFSWWCDGLSDKPRSRESWHNALLIAAELLLEPPPDPTGGSLFYHSTSVQSPWMEQLTRTAQIGQHVFYRL